MYCGHPYNGPLDIEATFTGTEQMDIMAIRIWFPESALSQPHAQSLIFLCMQVFLRFISFQVGLSFFLPSATITALDVSFASVSSAIDKVETLCVVGIFHVRLMGL